MDDWLDWVYLDFQNLFDIMEINTPRGSKRYTPQMDDRPLMSEISTAIRGKHSAWRGVISRISQGSALAPITFRMFINDFRSN